jgi:MtaA/CmuA family methyltransferase
MTSLQRFRDTLDGRPTDHLPAQPFCMMYAARHLGVSYADYCRDHRLVVEGQLKLHEDFGIDCLVLSTDPARELIDMVGEGSVEWIDNQGPVVDESRAWLDDPRKLLSLSRPDPLGGGRMTDRVEGVRKLRKAVGDAASVVGWIEGPISGASELRGINHVMEDLIDDPAFAADLFDFVVDVEVAFARAQLDAGADTIGMGESATCLLGPAQYRDLALPRQRRILEQIRASHPHARLRFHCCGSTTHLLDLINTLPADMIELDYPVDLAHARTRLPAKAISGNISTVETLVSGTPDDVYAAAAACHRAVGPRYIVGSGCDVAPMTPPDNLRALVRYARDHAPLLPEKAP